FFMRLKSNLAADGALMLTTLIWGSTFFMAKDILSVWPPMAYMFVRFVAASLLLAALFPRQLASARREEWRAGATLGILMGIGFGLQAAGQVYTTASKSAFVTGLSTPLVPFVAYLILRTKPGVENLIGVALASLGGLLILAPQGADASVNLGDMLTLCATVLFATHITLLSVYARRHDVRQLTVLQIATIACLYVVVWVTLRGWGSLFGAESLPPALARETLPLVWSARVLWQLAYTATVATVGAFLFWTWGQARTSPTHAAIIFSLEPVFATAFAVAVIGAGEWMGGRGWLGAGLVFAGIIVSELRWTKTTRRQAEAAARGDAVA
ncbi:MAG TPA: DMT family transporter, partial [Pyrinomonadaceae bacterium]|nr:DMT family transporter [Pyrinomonadaceae bacterium]